MKQKQNEPELTEPELTEADVAAFLAANPDFFERRDSLLLQLKLPHGKQGAVSLIEKQLAVLREKYQTASAKLNTLFSFAERNKKTLDKCRKLTLNLIAADSRDQFLEAMEKSFTHDFKCQAYSLILFDDAADDAGTSGQASATAPCHFLSRVTTRSAGEQISALIQARQPVLGPLRPAEREFLFREHSGQVRSAVVLPVNAGHLGDDHQPIALLAIGSEDIHYFDSDMDTIFLGLVADTLGRLIPRHLLS